MHTGVSCIASERSWQTALLSSVFLFSSSWLREKSRVPAELEMDVPVPLLFDFCRLCRVILAGESWRDQPFPDHLQWLAANISSYLSVSLFLSRSLSLVWAYSWALFSLSLSLFFSSPHLLFSFWPSWGAHNLPLSSGCFLTPLLKREKKGRAERQKGQLPQCSESWSAFCHSCSARKVTT